jgi:hypothetical protein
MPIDAGARCLLQIALDRRLRIDPTAFGLEQDICDVTLWLQEKFQLSSVHVWIDRHSGGHGRKISGVFVVATPWHPGPVSLSAHEAFLALGYEIADTGAEIFAHPLCDGKHSRHEAMQAYARIEGALRSSRSL